MVTRGVCSSSYNAPNHRITVGNFQWHDADADVGGKDLESAMTQPAKVQEPSMEEILASIRRIIADDEGKPVAESQATAPQAASAAPATAQANMKQAPAVKLADTHNQIAKTPPVAAAAAPSNSQDDIDALLAGFDGPEPVAESAPAIAPVEEDVFELTDDMAIATDSSSQNSDVEFTEAIEAERRSIERQAYAAISQDAPSFAQPQILSNTAASSVEHAFNSLASTVLTNNARTLEDLVKDMMRPMLKSWLDNNLPSLVERIVKAEIERVSRGR